MVCVLRAFVDRTSRKTGAFVVPFAALATVDGQDCPADEEVPSVEPEEWAFGYRAVVEPLEYLVEGVVVQQTVEAC